MGNGSGQQTRELTVREQLEVDIRLAKASASWSSNQAAGDAERVARAEAALVAHDAKVRWTPPGFRKYPDKTGMPPIDKPVTAGSMLISKPSKINGAWHTVECGGRLVLGTGCGHCLRCNREWYVLVKGPGVRMVGEQLCIDAERVKLAQVHSERFNPVQTYQTGDEHLSGNPILEKSLDDAMRTPQTVLDVWVSMWNDASIRTQLRQMQELDDQLRNMTFPDGCELVTDWRPDLQCHQKRLVWTGSDASETP